MVQDPRQEYLDDLITRWEKTMLRLCFAYLCDTALAEDAINTCKDLMKSAWMRNTDRFISPDALPEGEVPFDERDDTVTRAVLSLPPKIKEVTLLHWYQGMTLEEMTRVLRLPRSTVNYRLKKAKMMLKKELEDWYYEDE